MTTDAYTPADHALEICGRLATAECRIGAPVLVRDGRQAVLYPPILLPQGVPMVVLVVQSDGVIVLAERHRLYGVLGLPRFFRYPTGAGWPDALWTERVDVWLTAALKGLPAAGHAPASP